MMMGSYGASMGLVLAIKTLMGGSYIGELACGASGLIQRAYLKGMPHGNPNQGGYGLIGPYGLTFHLVTSKTLIS